MNNSEYYKYSDNGIKKRNPVLWQEISSNKLDIPFKEKFFLYENNLLDVPCCYCGNKLKFIDMINGYRSFCSKRCVLNSEEIKRKKQETCIERYGVDNPSKSALIKSLVKISNNIKFGVDYPLQSEDIKNKNKNYFIEKYGVDNPTKIKSIRDKALKTIKNKYGVDHIMFNDEVKNKNKGYFIEKYGVDNPSKVKDFRDRAKKTNLLKYGVEYALQNDIFLNKLKKTNLLKYGNEFYIKTDEYRERLNKNIFLRNSNIVNNESLKLISSKFDEFTIYCNICNDEFIIQRQLYRNRTNNNINVCLKCNPFFNGKSIDEKKILLYIMENYDGEILENFKIEKSEIDIYLPELKIGFEFNGLYWHSELFKDKNYHVNKTNKCLDHRIQLIHIWEDDWLLRPLIVKSMILNKLGKTKNKIYARKCEIKVIDNNQLVREFLDNNHIQGFVGSKIKLALFYENNIVSLMTFGNLRNPLGQKNKNDYYELLRFSNLINTNVIGAASKLFKYFIENYKPIKINSYSMNSYSNGNLYKNLGFNLSGESLNYFWAKNGIKYHRFLFRKDRLVKLGFDKNFTETQIMYSNKYFKIFDCGIKKWTFIHDVNPVGHR